MQQLIDYLRQIIKRSYSLAIRITLFRITGLEIGQRVTFLGRPIIDIRHGGKVIIKDDVTINSRNYGYHLNMFGPVKLYADRPDAIITIGEKTRIHGTCLHAYSSISIGERCLIASNCQIMDGSGHDFSFDNVKNRINTKGYSQPIVIEDDVWIGTNTIILPGVKICKGSVIGAGSVVAKDIPPMVFATGNPAKVIKIGGLDIAGVD